MAGILDTFFFIFDADARKLEQGVEDARRSTDKLEKTLNETDAAANEVGASLVGLAGKAAAALGSFLAIGTVVATIRDTAQAMDELNDRAEALQVPIGELQAYAQAATMTAGSQEGFIASLETLNRELTAVVVKGTGRMLPFLKELGFSMADIKRAAADPFEALRMLSTEFEKLDKREAQALGAKLGLDRGTVNLLQLGSAGIAQLVARQKELGVTTTEQAEKAAKFADQLDEWRAVFGDVKRDLVSVILPPLTEFFRTLSSIVGWVRDNSEVVTGFFGALAVVLAVQYAPAAIAAAAASWALVAPWIAVAAAVGGFAAILALVVDDLYNFANGNDSVIGELSKKWPMLGKTIHAIGAVFVGLLGLVRAFATGFATLIEDGPEAALYAFSEAVGFLVSYISERFPIVGRVFGFVTGAMQSAIEAVVAVWDWLVSRIGAGIEMLAGFAASVVQLATDVANALGDNDEDEAGKTDAAAEEGRRRARERRAANIANAQSTIGTVSRAPLLSQSSGALANGPRTVNSTTTKSVNVNGPITIQTAATDADGISRDLNRSLTSQLRGAIDDNDDGVAA